MLWTVIFLVLGVGGIVATIVIGWLALKARKPIYYISGTNLVSSSISKYGELGITFANKPVPQVTLSKVCIWNAGRGTIRKEDIAPADSIRVSVAEGIDILSCSKIASSREVICGKVEQDDAQSYRILFDFLDKDDWLMIYVLHTGRQPSDCKVYGTVMDCKGGIQRFRWSRLDRYKDILSVIVVASCLFFITSDIIRDFGLYRYFPNLSNYLWVAFAIVSILAYAIIGYAFFRRRWKLAVLRQALADETLFCDRFGV